MNSVHESYESYELKKAREARASGSLDHFELCAPLNKKGVAKKKKSKRLVFVEIPEGMKFKRLGIVRDPLNGQEIDIDEAVVIYHGDEEEILHYTNAWYNDYSERFEHFETPKVSFFNGENDEGYTTKWQMKLYNMVWSNHHNAYLDKDFAVEHENAIVHSSEVT